MRQILAIASATECEGISTGKGSTERILNKLGRQNLAAFNNYKVDVILESLKTKHAEVFPVSEADAAAAFAALYNSLSEEDKARYHSVTGNSEQSSAEDQCWLLRTMYQGVESFPEPSRSKLARLLLGQEQGKP